MAYNSVLIVNQAQASNIDALNRYFISSDNIQNGNVFNANGKSATAGEGEVWSALKPATGGNALKISLKLIKTAPIAISTGAIGSHQVTAYQFEVVDNTGGLWMANEPEVVVTVSGNSKFKGIDPDPRNFTNLAGYAFTAFQPKVGDIVTISADGLGGSKGENTYVVAKNGQYALEWASSAN